MRRSIVFLALALLLATACAGEPAWKKGDTWTVKTFQRETALVPSGPRRLAIPGHPPLVDGVPAGWKPANRWRLTVDREEEGYTVILLRSLEGEARKAELFFKDGKLARIGKRVLKKTLDLPESRELAFPLDWPDVFLDWKAGAKWWSSFECAGVRGELEGPPP